MSRWPDRANLNGLQKIIQLVEARRAAVSASRGGWSIQVQFGISSDIEVSGSTPGDSLICRYAARGGNVIGP